MEGFYVYLSSDSSEKLFPDNKKSAFTVKLSEAIDFDPRYKWSVALTEVLFPGNTSTPPRVDVTADSGPIFAYTDIVRNSRVGDSSSKLLRIISPHLAHQTFVDRYYIPVDTARVDRISVLLTNRLGKKYPLASGTVPVIVVIHFRCETI